MSLNYFIQNTGRDEKPMNIKEVVLDTLRGYNIFVHLRDEGCIGYDMEKYLLNEDAGNIEEIKTLERKIENKKKKLEELKANPEAWYDAYVKEKTEDFLEAKREVEEIGGRSEYRERVSGLERRIKALQEFLEGFKLEADRELESTIKQDVLNMVKALTRDLYEYTRRAEEEEKVMQEIREKEECLESCEQWVTGKVKKLEEEVKAYQELLEDTREVVAEGKEKDEKITRLFEALEPFDKEVE